MFEEQDFKPKLETELSNQLMNIVKGPQIDLFTYDPGYATNAQTFLGFSNREEFYPYIKSGPLILKEVYMILKNKRESTLIGLFTNRKKLNLNLCITS